MVIKVLLYEDNENLRNSVEALLKWNKEYNLIAALPDANFVVEDVNALEPDVILMDIEMPNSNGVEAVLQLRRENGELPVIMFTVFEDDENIFNAICAGANGYILKKNFDQIPTAIKDVLEGGAPMTGSVAKKVLSFIPKKNITASPQLESLSKREIEILEHITKGYSYKMIGDSLQIATETVRTHIKHIYKKLQVNSATEAVYKFKGSK